jgi:hypothetical protein
LGAYTHQPFAGLQVSVVQGFPSSQALSAPVQTLPRQTSPVVQGEPSSQGVPSGVKQGVHPEMGTWTHTHIAGSQRSVVQGLASSQITGIPTQEPPEQASPKVQQLPSSHGVPSGWTAQSTIPPVGRRSWADAGAEELKNRTTPAAQMKSSAACAKRPGQDNGERALNREVHLAWRDMAMLPSSVAQGML